MQDIRLVERGGFYVMLLTKMNIQTEAYPHNHLGYDVTCLAAQKYSTRGSQGAIGMVMREQPDEWGIESTRFHGPNVVSYKIVTGRTKTPVVGAYLPPSTLEHLLDVEELQQLKGLNPIAPGILIWT